MPRWVLFVRHGFPIALLFMCALMPSRTALAQDRLLVDVIAELNRDGPWRIVYQDALLNGIRVQWPSPVRDVPNTLRAVVREAGLDVEVQSELRTLVVFRPVGVAGRRLRGTVVDRVSGERLSYATIRVGQRGVAADASGQFTLVLPENASRIVVTYIGYEADTLHAPFADELRITLRPTVIERRGAVVLAGARGFQPFGVASLSRTEGRAGGMGLMALRDREGSAGSPPEGLHVVLDGVPVYSPTHMLGAHAAFAPEALRTMAYFDEGAPARFSDPPGGTLALVTRSGSAHRWEGEVGVMPTSAYVTAHGPIARDRVSLLASAQFGAPHLSAMGAPLVRNVLAAPRRTLFSDTTRLSFEAQDASLFFHDFHLRLGQAWESGAYAFISAYTGGNRARTSGSRWISRSLTDPTLVRSPAQMRSLWGNQTASAHVTAPIAAWLVSGILAWSHYTARFAQSDFRFAYAPEEALNPVRRPLDSLQYANTVWEVRATVSGTRSLHSAHTMVIGGTFIQYQSRYEEQSGRFLPAFGEIRQSPQIDGFAEHITSSSWGTLHNGMRVQAFLNGRFLRFAPRIRLETPTERALGASLSLSRNHQFVHALSFPYTPTPRVWVLSTRGEPPLSATSAFATLRYRAHPALSLHLRGFVREMTHVRLHEAAPGSGLSEPVTLQAPWRTDLNGRVRGMESGFALNTARVHVSGRYTLSSVVLFEPNGDMRAAPWDRRHSAEAELNARIAAGWNAQLRSRWASGAPNRLFPQFPHEPHRLPAIGSVDVGATWTKVSAAYAMEVHLGIAHVVGGSSVWYRDFVEFRTGPEAQERLSSVATPILDSGMQPFFRLRVSPRPMP